MCEAVEDVDFNNVSVRFKEAFFIGNVRLNTPKGVLVLIHGITE